MQSDPLAFPGRPGPSGAGTAVSDQRPSTVRTALPGTAPAPGAALRRYAGEVLNEFWATATASYKVLVFGAVGLIAAGIILNIVGNVSGNQGVAIASLPVIGAGLLLHGAGRVVRGRKVSRMLRK
ncbi:DUF3188 domain-containing protein [Neomicrococcus lactis]|uniref:DUF3188 domain-containing protein n=1 Tax=Neomicrococcus lactis TaxID=732241 RepID=UPI003A5C8841